MARAARKTRAAGARAAQYLRMSTDHQRYSIENQVAAIAAYARRRGYKIVKTYSDEGISGLRLRNRKGLQSLLADVVGGAAEFTTVLVLDVSRWGRFQNPDQSAHYEFLCSDAGVPVEYCAEVFENDGSLSSTLLKNLKRVMAAEYSRELSVKTSAGKKRLARKGYWMQGPPGLGLRRQVIDETGRPVVILLNGQRKAVQNHRVTLVPGPPEEIALVNRIYRLFVDNRMRKRAIVRLLNAEGQVTDMGRPWTMQTLNSILHNPKYVGDLVYNRVSTPLGGKAVLHPRSDWKMSQGVFEPIVERNLFTAAQEIHRANYVHMATEDMLPALAKLLEQHGKLSGNLITNTPGLPREVVFRRRLGGLRAAYAALGYDSPISGRRRPSLSNEEMLRRLAQLFEDHDRLSANLVDVALDLPSADTYARRFGSVSAAFALVGYVGMTPAEQVSPVGQARKAAGIATRRSFSITLRQPWDSR